MKRALLLAAAALLFAGCSTYEVSREGGRTTVSVQNTGWFLFTCLPIASGEPDMPNRAWCRFGEDTVNIASNMQILKTAMRRERAYRATDITSRTTDEKVFFILLSRNVCHTSAELITEDNENSKTRP